MSAQILQTLGEYGVAVVALNVFVDQLGLPVPAVPTLIVAGTLGAAGQLSLPAVFTASVLASLAADATWFQIGKLYGIRVLKLLCRISLEPDSCVSDTQTRFERWGVNSLVIAKFVPGLAIIAPPMAGALRISWRRFLGLSTLAGILWTGSGLLAGMLFREQIELLLANLNRIGSTAALGAAIILAVYITYKWWERRRFFEALRMARINVADLYELIQAGSEPLIIDVRTSSARSLEPRWIPGAVHVPMNDISRSIKDLPRDREIILYCSCPSEASAARVAKVLMNRGFTRVRPLQGGLEAWIAAGYEAAVGVNPQIAAPAGPAAVIARTTAR